MEDSIRGPGAGSNTAKRLRVLIVEDNPDDAELIVYRLESEKFIPDWVRVETRKAYEERLATRPLPDIILSDWSVPGFGGLKALDILSALRLNIPFIIVSGKIGEEAAVDILRRGAYDYVSKDNLVRLGQSVRNALDAVAKKEEATRTDLALKESEAKYRAFMEATQDTVILKNEARRYVMVNHAAEVHYGRPASEILGRTIEELIPAESARGCHESDDRALRGTGVVTGLERYRGRMYETRKFPISIGAERMIGGYVRDVTEEHFAARRLEIEVKVGTILREHSTRQGIISGALELLGSFESTISASFNPVSDRQDSTPPNGGGRSGQRSITVRLPRTDKTSSAGEFVIVRRNEPDAEELELLDFFAQLVAGALNIADLKAETRERLGRLNALAFIDESISRDADLDSTLSLVLDQTMALLKAEAAEIFLLDERRSELRLAVVKGFKIDHEADKTVPLGQIYIGLVAADRRTIFVSDLSDLDPDTVFARIVASEGFHSYICAPLVVKSKLLGAIGLYFRSELSADSQIMSFFEMIARQAAIAIENKTLYRNEQNARQELEAAYDATIEGWSRAMDLRDRQTEGHSRRVTELALALARKLGVMGEALVNVRRGALLHDIGKIAVPDKIMHKPGPLTQDEWAIMKKHPGFALDMLWPISYLRPSLDIPYGHHEKWDGSGYPQGLSGEAIPLAARIFTVVDVWDALTSDRPYREAWPADKARDYLAGQAGKHFDPCIVQTFLAEFYGDAVDI